MRKLALKLKEMINSYVEVRTSRGNYTGILAEVTDEYILLRNGEDIIIRIDLIEEIKRTNLPAPR